MKKRKLLSMAMFILLFGHVESTFASTAYGQQCSCTLPSGFVEDWSNGVSPDRWLLFRKQWGSGNNGTVPELVSIQKDNVNGVTKNVLVLTAQGDQTTSSILGVKKVSGGYTKAASAKRVGACIATADYYASGSYLVRMKIGRPKNNPSGLPVGMAPSIWTFHYEEHYTGANNTNGTLLNPLDPIYQPRYKEGNSTDGFYSTVNSELDIPEIGVNGQFNQGLYTTYVSEVYGASQNINYANFGINLMDGRYHEFKTEWHTNLVATSLTDSQVVPYGNYYYAADSASSSIQGFPVFKKSDGIWYVATGKSAIFYVDGIQVGTSTNNVSPISARFIVGAWFPSWAGVPSWDEAKVYISDIIITPYYEAGDIYNEFETYPIDGLVPPPPKLQPAT